MSVLSGRIHSLIVRFLGYRAMCRTLLLGSILFGAALLSAQAQAQEATRAEQIIKRAVEALGGQNFLNVRSITSRGRYTQYQDGKPTVPVAFVDYLVYPDRERTEFRASEGRIIQTNVGKTGWVYDGAARTLRDMKPDQIADFQRAMRTSYDNVTRGWWRAEGARLSYVGRREAGVARRNEVVRLDYSDGFSVEFEFDARTGLPAKAIYKRRNDKGEESTEEDRFLRFLDVNGVMFPFVVDHYRDGVQTSRVNYDEVEFNRPIPDALFARPADARSVK
ncbi:MAG: hypothetical protein C4334_11405 [Pyrinomonas sp.]|uniref:hypothetical protein n=1 Tax=Pyrinomonas sp. TaxID=2080306 RepID=UPI0033190FB0